MKKIFSFLVLFLICFISIKSQRLYNTREMLDKFDDRLSKVKIKTIVTPDIYVIDSLKGFCIEEKGKSKQYYIIISIDEESTIGLVDGNAQMLNEHTYGADIVCNILSLSNYKKIQTLNTEIQRDKLIDNIYENDYIKATFRFISKYDFETKFELKKTLFWLKKSNGTRKLYFNE